MIEVKNAKLGWTLRHDDITFDPDGPYVTLNLIPEFPFCATDIADDTIVWDLMALINSVEQPGAYQILNCTCTCADCAGILDKVFVSHPDDKTVIWEMDIPAFRYALDSTLDDDTFIRYIFERDSYEASLRSMLREVQAAIRNPYPIETFQSHKHYADFVKEFPDLSQLPVECFEPDHGYDHFEYLEAVDPEQPWQRKPLFAEGTLIEIGLFDKELYLVDGCVYPCWIENLITRWDTRKAYHRWADTFTRRYHLEPLSSKTDEPCALLFKSKSEHVETPALIPDHNSFIPLPGLDEDCRLTGEAFTIELARCFSEGGTAPDVVLRYVVPSNTNVGRVINEH